MHSLFTYYMKYRDCRDITAVFLTMVKLVNLVLCAPIVFVRLTHALHCSASVLCRNTETTPETEEAVTPPAVSLAVFSAFSR